MWKNLFSVVPEGYSNLPHCTEMGCGRTLYCGEIRVFAFGGLFSPDMPPPPLPYSVWTFNGTVEVWENNLRRAQAGRLNVVAGSQSQQRQTWASASGSHPKSLHRANLRGIRPGSENRFTDAKRSWEYSTSEVSGGRKEDQRGKEMERDTGFEPATSSLGSWHSTN